MRYKCLVFDHDDTTVNSTSNVHYPSFVEFMKIKRPGVFFSLEEYVKYNFDPGILAFFRDVCRLTEQEIVEEQDFWQEYTSRHVSQAFDGIREIMERERREGGFVAVISHSFRDNIVRDYKHNGLELPEMIFGWEQPKEERKPSPVPIYKIMERYSLRREDILVIDDLKPGYDMARAAGVDFAAAGWCFDIPENRRFMKENADCFCKSTQDLMQFCFEP